MSQRYQVAYWRRNNKGTGAGAVFTIDGSDPTRRNAAWFTMMPQNGEESFDNSRKIVAKLGPADIGAMLAVIYGRIDGLGQRNDKGYWSGLLHTSSAGNTGLNFYRGENGYVLGLVRSGEGQDTVRMNIGMNAGEVEQLRVFCEAALMIMMVDPPRNTEGGGNRSQRQRQPRQDNLTQIREIPAQQNNGGRQTRSTRNQPQPSSSSGSFDVPI